VARILAKTVPVPGLLPEIDNAVDTTPASQDQIREMLSRLAKCNHVFGHSKSESDKYGITLPEYRFLAHAFEGNYKYTIGTCKKGTRKEFMGNGNIKDIEQLLKGYEVTKFERTKIPEGLVRMYDSLLDPDGGYSEDIVLHATPHADAILKTGFDLNCSGQNFYELFGRGVYATQNLNYYDQKRDWVSRKLKGLYRKMFSDYKGDYKKDLYMPKNSKGERTILICVANNKYRTRTPKHYLLQTPEKEATNSGSEGETSDEQIPDFVMPMGERRIFAAILPLFKVTYNKPTDHTSVPDRLVDHYGSRISVGDEVEAIKNQSWFRPGFKVGEKGAIVGVYGMLDKKSNPVPHGYVDIKWNNGFQKVTNLDSKRFKVSRMRVPDPSVVRHSLDPLPEEKCQETKTGTGAGVNCRLNVVSL